jgi:two-component system, NarL family, response regulator LiaR
MLAQVVRMVEGAPRGGVPRAPVSIAVGIVADNGLLCDALSEVIGDDPELHVIGIAIDEKSAKPLLDDVALRVLVVSLALAPDGGRESGLGFIERARRDRRDIGILSLKRGQEESLLRAAIEAGANACCLVGAPQVRLVRAIKAVSLGATWLDPEIAEVIFRARKPGISPIPRLTARERTVLQLITEGYSNIEMATTLHCAAGTIHTHVVNVFEKLGVHDRVSAAVYALRKGLISENVL